MRCLTLALLLLAQPALADITSEIGIVLRGDGEHYLMRRAMHTPHKRFNFHLDKSVRKRDLLMVTPEGFEWDAKSSRDTNILHFKGGSFTVIYPGRFGRTELRRSSKGVFTYTNHRGKPPGKGHYGYWTSPSSFKRFDYIWVLPDNFELVGFKANRKGDWSRKGNTLSYRGRGVNDLVFTIRYRLRSQPADQAAPLVDSDQDGIDDTRDRCADTRKGQPVLPNGCAPAAKKRAAVSAPGFKAPPDSDRDGVADNMDKCPDTPHGTLVLITGCPPAPPPAPKPAKDSDNDGVPNDKDSCPGTNRGTLVLLNGCPPPKPSTLAALPSGAADRDSDGDGVSDARDLCPNSQRGSHVDRAGCGLDTDRDGVADGLDQCPATGEDLPVNAVGCAVDHDLDGVENDRDICPDTGPDVTVDATGCVPNQPINLVGVEFKPGSANLTPDSIAVLTKLARVLKRNDQRFEIAGHTDSAGDAAVNTKLSQLRASAVREQLIALGVPATRLTAQGYGEQFPIADNRTVDGRARNRRVELRRLD